MSGNGSVDLEKLQAEWAKVPACNPEVISALEGLLASARRGEVKAVGLVVVGGPGKVSAGMAGSGQIEVYVGCDMLKGELMRQMTGGGGRGSGLLLPRR